MQSRGKIKEVLICPYCEDEKLEMWSLCCGEVHFEYAYRYADGGEATKEDYEAQEKPAQ